MSGPRLTKFKIGKFRGEVDPSEILLDNLAHKKERQLGVSEKRLEVPISRKAFRVFFFAFLAIAGLIFAKTFQMQVLDGKAYAKMASDNQFAVRLIQAERGVIYDSNMKQLVFNEPSFDLVVNTNDLPSDQASRDQIFSKIASITGVDYQSLEKEVDSSKLAQITIAKDISHQSIILLEADAENLPGTEIVSNAERQYLSDSLFSQIVGYRTESGQTAGLEQYYNDVLSPTPGKLYIERDAQGNPISKKVVSMPQSGDSLVLNLNSGLQKVMTDALASSIAAVKGTGGAAIAMDPRTGGVLALVSLPSYNSNLFSQGISQQNWQSLQDDPGNPLFNRAISGVGYPTGSTIKPLIASAALQEGLIKANTVIDCPLQICVQNPWSPSEQTCFKDWTYHGPSNVERAIAESVNTFFYQIGGGYQNVKGLGATAIEDWLGKFNWGKKSGIDLPSEGVGILPTLDKNWTIGDTYHLSIGQGPFSIPPIEEAAAYAAIANGGTLYKPEVVNKIIDSNGNVVKNIAPQVITKVPVSADNLQTVRAGMEQGVTSPAGSSHMLDDLPVTAAAKTGTAQTAYSYLYDNWVSVFAPYDNPQIVLTIVVENVHTDANGAIPAAVLPVANTALQWYFSTSTTP